MKLYAALAVLGLWITGTAQGADYSVGIVNLGSGALGGGSAINLYSTTRNGIKLVQQYVFQQKDWTGNLAEPLTLAINPAHNYVYVVYTGHSLAAAQPIIVGFQITSTGLVYDWQHQLQTGDSGLQGTTLTAGPNYVIENTYPFDLWVHVLSQAGEELMTDIEDDFDSTYVVSDSVDSTRTYYYSGRAASYPAPATSVAVFRFESGTDVSTGTATPLGTSTDPLFIQSVCN